MRLVCISDTHNAHKGLHIPDGDVLIHAGDATGQGLTLEVERFLGWFGSQPHPHKILIAGNHDWLFQRGPERAAQLLAQYPGVTYLQDSGVTLEGVRFWGSPWQPWFCDWAFNLPRNGAELHEVWGRIPIDTDVLITHGPPLGVLDQVKGGPYLGCEALKARLAAVRPRIHVFGHIHDSFGVAQSGPTTYLNACICDEDYRPNHRPIMLDLFPDSIKVHGIEPSQRLERLLRIQAALDQPREIHSGEIPHHLLSGQLVGLIEMAEIRGLDGASLLQDYVERGLRFDVAKHLRVERKPSKQAIPFTNLGNEHGQ